MKKNYTIFLFSLLFTFSNWAQGVLQPFLDTVEQHADFTQTNLEGWTSLDLDGLNTAGPFQSFPGKGGPLGFMVYNIATTTPANTLPACAPYSGQKYFVSISSYDGPSNDWLISDELTGHPGGVLSFYAKSAFDYSGPDEFKVGYSTTGENPADFILFNSGNPTSTTVNWTKFEYVIPAGAKHLAINCVSYAVMFMVDDIQFVPNVAPLAPNTITNITATPEIGTNFQVTHNWTNPIIDFAGNSLADMTGVKIYRGTSPMNLTEIADLPSAVGQSMSYIDVLPGQGSYIHRFIPYNSAGNGKAYTTPLTFVGYETVPGAPVNINFTQDANLHTVISWDPVNYGENGGVLQDPVVGYKIQRTLGTTTQTLVEMNASTTFTETDIPTFNLYKYTIQAQTSPTNLGVPAIVSNYSGMGENQVSVTSGAKADNQPFELSETSIITQSIYTPAEIGDSGLITSLSYFGNLGATSTARYKIYMSVTDRDTFGTTQNNAVWEYFGDQKLLFDGMITFPAGRNAINIDLDQPFYYDASSNKKVIITIVKPMLTNPPSVNPREFYNTPVEGMRTYFAKGYTVDLSLITSQPAAWATTAVPSIPSIVVEKRTDYGSLAGTVTLLEDDSPLADVTVTITPEGSATYQIETVLTNALGEYNVPALLPGTYLASFSKNAFNTTEMSIVIEENEQLTLDVKLDNSVPIVISGSVVNSAGNPIEGVTLKLTGFSAITSVTNVGGNFTLNAFAEKNYNLEISHPLYGAQSMIFTTGLVDYTLDPIILTIIPHKPGNVIAVNNNGVGEVQWRIPMGNFNETTIGYGSFLTAGDAWGNGGDPFIAGIRFEPSDLHAQVAEGAELTHVKAYIANNAEIIIKVFEGANGAELIHSQPASISEEGWFVFELTNTVQIDPTKELWIGIDFLGGQYGSYPIGLDDGPNAPGRKGSMKYENGVWTGLNLTNKNWNIYGIVNNTMDADPSGYRVYRSPASVTNWTELTTSPITETSFNDTTLSSATPDIYKYGITAEYAGNLVSEKGISNEIQHNMFFDFNVNIETDFGNATGAYVSVWNSNQFAEAFITSSSTSVTFNELLRGNYNLRVELDNYAIVELTDVSVENNTTLTVPLNLLKVQPSNLTATMESSSSARLDWTLHTAYNDQVEKYADFERQNIGNYILKDLDGLETYTYTNFTWPNAGVPMSFMVFNPFATTPAVSIDAFSGRRFLTAFAGPDGANNDWLIIPAGSGNFSFMAASLVGTAPEKIRVLYSTTGSEVSDFTAFGGVTNVPANWTEYTYEAPEETKFVAINYVSNDTYILKIDNLIYEKNYNHNLSYNIYLDGVLVSENVMETTFTLPNLTNGTHIAEVEAVYETGVSEKTEVIISVLNVENYAMNEFQIYPNPSSGKFSLVLANKANVSIIDMHGRVLNSSVKDAGTSTMDYNLAAGTYIIQVKSEKGTSSKKLIVY